MVRVRQVGGLLHDLTDLDTAIRRLQGLGRDWHGQGEELERLRGGIQKLIDECQACGGEGERSMVPGGMGKCMDCLPLRDLIHPISNCCELAGEAWKHEDK